MGWITSMVAEARSSHPGPPTDVAYLALLTYFGLGVAYLLPWNAFLTAVDYFEYLYPNSHIDRVFTVAYLFPGLTVMILILAYGQQTSSRCRINVGLVMLLFSILVVPIVDALFISGEGGGDNSLAHVVTVLAVAFAGMGDALVQTTVIGVAGDLPDRYMQAIVSGTAACGVLVSFLRIVTKAALSQNVQGLRTSANFYFIIGSGFLVIIILAYNQVHKLAVMIHFEDMKNSTFSGSVEAQALAARQDLENDSSTLLFKATNAGNEHYSSITSSRSPSVPSSKSLLEAFVPLKWVSVSFILIYVITLCIFPGFLAEDVHSAFFTDWYPILLIATFNVFDLVGKLGTLIYTPTTQSVTVAGSVVRLLFFPLFAACLHGPKVFRTEGPVFVLTALLGATNGYFTSTGFIIAPKIVAPSEVERAGTIMVISLAVGLTLGSLVSWVWVI
ncbi:hypothetical protein Mapa_006508 [Marchantia paleacea]|nr:hypothetical protein Mapa_006508 [Marchantia paleacea]